MLSAEGVINMSNDEEVVRVAISYVNVKIRRGDWWGRTVSVYRRHLLGFAASLSERVASAIRRVRRQHIQAWLDDPGPRHSPAYRRVRYSAVRGMFRWATLEGKIDRDPCVDIEIPDIPQPVPRSFTDEEIAALFRCAHRDPRDLVCVSLCWNEMLRRAEVANALIEDIDFHRRTLSVRGKGYRGKVSRIIRLSDETLDAINGYLRVEPARGGHLIRSRIIPGTGVSPSRIGEIVAAVIRDAGLKNYPWDGRSSHAGRHSGLTHALEDGVPAEVLRRFVGHRSDAHLARYTAGAVLDYDQIHTKRAERRRAREGEP